MTGVEVATATLTDHVTTTADGRRVSAVDRLTEVVALGLATEAHGLDGFAIGEHHSEDFVVSSPAVVLAAVAARTRRIRLGTAVTVLAANDPVRLQEDFATLDQLSGGRAEITVGRGAFVEPFALFGTPHEVFAERLGLLLALRREGPLTWRGRYRPAVEGLGVHPRPVQDHLPVWVGVGGTPGSAARAGALGLPMTIGSIAMPFEQVHALAEVYRAAGAAAGHGHELRLGVGVHLLVAASTHEAREAYPYYRDFLGPKRPGANGLHVSEESFGLGFAPTVARAVGDTDAVVQKLSALHRLVRFDRLQVLPDWGGLPRELVDQSLTRFAQDVVPALRRAG